MSFQITIQIPLISSVTVQTLLQEVLRDHNFRDSDNKQAFLQNFFNGRFPNTTQHFCLNLFFKKKNTAAMDVESEKNNSPKFQ